MMPAFTLRTESSNPAHTTIRVFAHGASAGLLTLRNDEFTEFRARLTTHDKLVAALREVMDLAAEREVVKTVANLKRTVEAHEKARALLAEIDKEQA